MIYWCMESSFLIEYEGFLNRSIRPIDGAFMKTASEIDEVLSWLESENWSISQLRQNMAHGLLMGGGETSKSGVLNVQTGRKYFGPVNISMKKRLRRSSINLILPNQVKAKGDRPCDLRSFPSLQLDTNVRLLRHACQSAFTDMINIESSIRLPLLEAILLCSASLFMILPGL